MNKYSSKQLLESRNLFCLPFKISHDLQCHIITEVLKNGDDLGSWYGCTVRGLSPSTSDELAYDSRLNTNLDWKYRETSIAPLIEKLLAPLSEFYTPTRIKAFVQKIGSPLIEHCDKLNYSNNLLFRNFLGTAQFHEYFIEPDHEKQKCLALKIPLSTKSNSSGKTFLREGPNKYYMCPGENYFAMNESKQIHGADACDFYRGIIFLDGKINIELLEKLDLLEMPMEESFCV